MDLFVRNLFTLLCVQTDHIFITVRKSYGIATCFTADGVPSLLWGGSLL